MNAKAQTPLIVILGPTAIGKTSLSLELGKQWNGEIISADSRQFYRMMDIGTAKATPEEQAQLPHHLIDIANPDETVGLGAFLRLTRAAIDNIAGRGKTPFLVGGTGQYMRALIQGWQVPEVAPDMELRAKLEQQGQENPEVLWEQLTALDPEVIEFIHPHNIRRVIRALEVCIKSGKPFSEQRRRIPPPYHILQIGLTCERERLYARADKRVEAMLKAGLFAEVESLIKAGYNWELPAMSGLGYIQFKPYFEGEASLEEVAERIKLDTHDFIRRQYAWFSLKDPKIHWLDTAQDYVPLAESITKNFFH